MDDEAKYRPACDAAVAAAKEAGLLIARTAGRLDPAAIRRKALNDLVTEVDEEAQRIVVSHVMEVTPDAVVLGEEDVHQQVSDPAFQGQRWIIDPVDGTTNFTHGLPPYAVSIALQEAGVIQVGVVYDVSRDEMFTAVRGKGTYMNGARCAVSQRNQLGESLVVTGFPYKRFENMAPLLDVLAASMQQAQGLRRTGCAAVDLAAVACGRAEAFYEVGLHPWDLAAGSLLIEEAGGRVTNFANQPNRLFDRRVVASNGAIHEAILNLVKPMAEL